MKASAPASDTGAALPPRADAGCRAWLAAALQEGARLRMTVGQVEAEVGPDLLNAIVLLVDATCREGRVRMLLTDSGGNLTPEQVAQELAVSRPFVYKLLDSGELPFVKVGTHRRIPASAVERYLEAGLTRAREAEVLATASRTATVVVVDDARLRAAAKAARDKGDSAELKALLQARKASRIARSVAATKDDA